MAAFSRGLDNITARLSDVIEHLQSDGVQEQAEEQKVALKPAVVPLFHLAR